MVNLPPCMYRKIIMYSAPIQLEPICREIKLYNKFCSMLKTKYDNFDNMGLMEVIMFLIELVGTEIYVMTPREKEFLFSLDDDKINSIGKVLNIMLQNIDNINFFLS